MNQSNVDDSLDHTPETSSFRSASYFTTQDSSEECMVRYSHFEALLSLDNFLDSTQQTASTHNAENTNQQLPVCTQPQATNNYITLEGLLYTGDVLFPSCQTQELQSDYTYYQRNQSIFNHTAALTPSTVSSTIKSTPFDLLSPPNSAINLANGSSMSPLSIESDYFNSAPTIYEQDRHCANASNNSSASLDTSFMVQILPSVTGPLCDITPNTSTATFCSSTLQSLTSTLPTSFLQVDSRDITVAAVEILESEKEPSVYRCRRLSVSSTSSALSAASSSFSSSFSSNEGLYTMAIDTSVINKPRRHNNMYHCEYKGCSKSFTRTYNLKSHRRTHTDEKPFVCDICLKGFARQHDRNRHAKLHLGVKPYPCQFCSKSFARQDALNRHLKKDKRRMRRIMGRKDIQAMDENEDAEQNDEDTGVDLMDIYPPPCLMMKMRQRQQALRKKKLQQQRQLEKLQRNQH